MTATNPSADSRRSWAHFSQHMIRETGGTKCGRQSLRRQWRNLRNLAASCSASISDAEIRGLLGKNRDSLDPEKNDLKALVAYCVGKGLAEGKALIDAIERDLCAEPHGLSV